MTLTKYHLSSFGLTDIGLIREQNEDVWNALEECGFFALADGIGGHPAGEIAARAAITHLCDSIHDIFVAPRHTHSIEELSALFRVFYENANATVYELGRKYKQYQGMGTTLSTLFFHDDALIHGHVGDSRIYRLRDHVLTQLTDDHVKKKNLLTRAVGPKEHVLPEIAVVSILPDDVYLLCSDGLTSAISDHAIQGILTDPPSLEMATSSLIDAAKQAGGRDNITAVLVHVSG